MASILENVAKTHRTQALKMLYSSNETCTINIPGVKVPSSGSSLFGDLNTTTPTPIEKGPYKCFWYDAVNLYNPKIIELAIIGRYPTATSFAKFVLEDVLTNPQEVYSQTWFDMALDVVHQGFKYEVLGSERNGMANLPPYMLVVALKGESERRA